VFVQLFNNVTPWKLAMDDLNNGNIARMRERRNTQRALVGKCEGRRAYEGLLCSWGDIIKMDLIEMLIKLNST
jgi:hypothetical protein